MRILVLQHDHDSGLDALEPPLRAAGADIESGSPTRRPRRSTRSRRTTA